MEEEKKDEEKRTEEDSEKEKSSVPDKPPIIRLPCCPMRKLLYCYRNFNSKTNAH